MDLFLYLTCLLALFKVGMYYVQKVSKLNNISRLLTLKYREFHIWMNRLTFPMSYSSQVLKRHKNQCWARGAVYFIHPCLNCKWAQWQWIKMTRGKVWHGSQPWWFRRSGPQQHCCPSVMSVHCINSQLPTSVPCHLPKQRLSPQLNFWKWTSEGLQDDHCLEAARTENRHGKSFLPFFFFSLLRLDNANIFNGYFFSATQHKTKPFSCF